MNVLLHALAPGPGEFRACRKWVGCSTETRVVSRHGPLRHRRPHGIQLSPRHQIVAPNVIRSQALSLLFEAVRKGELTEALALVHHERLTELKMRLLGDRVSRRTAWRIAREQNWDTTYDAEFLAVTQLQAADATHLIARPIERRIRLTGGPSSLVGS